MRQNPRVKTRGREAAANVHHALRGRGDAAISTKHQLLSDWWTADVEALEGAIDRFRTDPSLTNNCEVVFRDRRRRTTSQQRDTSVPNEAGEGLGGTRGDARGLRSQSKIW
jgi:hypothetical protein